MTLWVTARIHTPALIELRDVRDLCPRSRCLAMEIFDVVNFEMAASDFGAALLGKHLPFQLRLAQRQQQDHVVAKAQPGLDNGTVVPRDDAVPLQPKDAAQPLDRRPNVAIPHDGQQPRSIHFGMHDEPEIQAPVTVMQSHHTGISAILTSTSYRPQRATYGTTRAPSHDAARCAPSLRISDTNPRLNAAKSNTSAAPGGQENHPRSTTIESLNQRRWLASYL
jgi:hypothetical protein